MPGGGIDPSNDRFLNASTTVAPPLPPILQDPEFSNIKEGGLFGINQALNLFNQGPQFAGFGDTSTQAQGQIKDLATGNPFLPDVTQSVAGVTQQSNPFTDAFQNQMNGSNPFVDQFQNFQNQQNPHLDALFNQGADNIRDRINSQFGLTGNAGGSQHFKTSLDDLSVFGANLYGNAFDSMQNRNLQALQGGSNAFNTNRGLNLQAIQGGANSFANNTNQQLQAAGMIPQLNDAKFDDARQLQALGSIQDLSAQAELDSPFQNLQNFTDIVAALQGTQPPDRVKSSSFDKLLGAGSIIGGLGFRPSTTPTRFQGNPHF